MYHIHEYAVKSNEFHRVQSNEQHMTLEEDRVFHTCHLLPKNAHAE